MIKLLIILIGIARLAVPVSLQLLHTSHNYHNMGTIFDDPMIIELYLIAAGLLFIIEMAHEAGYIDGDWESLFVKAYYLTVGIGIFVNLLAYSHNHPHQWTNPEFYLKLIGIGLISVLTEMLIKLVIKIVSGWLKKKK